MRKIYLRTLQIFFIKKTNNNEVIFVKDFKLQSGKTVSFTVQNQPWSGTEDLEGGRLNPSLNLVQSFELLDNSFPHIPNKG